VHYSTHCALLHKDFLSITDALKPFLFNQNKLGRAKKKNLYAKYTEKEFRGKTSESKTNYSTNMVDAGVDQNQISNDQDIETQNANH
jgi:hypothetical protein